MAVIEYDTPEDAERAEAIRAGLVYCEILNPKTIGVYYRGIGDPNNSVAMSHMKKMSKVEGKIRLDAEPRRVEVKLTATNLKTLEHMFGDLFEPTEELDEWGYAEIDRINNIENLSSANSDATLSKRMKLEAPLIYHTAFPYQRAGIAFGTATKRYGLFDQPGLGKTIQTLGAVVESDIAGDILILAPTAAVAITWPDELGKWLPQDEVVVVNGTGPKRRKLIDDTMATPRAGKRRWFIVNLEMARAEWVKPTREFRAHKRTGEKKWFPVPGWWQYRYPQLFLDQVAQVPTPWQVVVVDESHRALITHSSELQGQTQIRAGMAQIPVAADGLKIALSGTPMRGKPENLWGTLNWLDPDKYSAYWDWANRWFMVWNDENNAKIIDGLDESKAAAFYQDIKPYVLRRTKKEVRAELPDKLYAGTPLPDKDGEIDENSPVGHWIELSPKQQKAYDEIKADAEAMLESGVLVANGTLAELVRLKQFATCYGDMATKTTADRVTGEVDTKDIFVPSLPSAKYDWLVEFLDDLGINKNSSMEPDEEVRKVVVASQFTGILDVFDEALQKRGIATLKITGKVNAAQRKAAAHTWQAPGGPRVFLLNTMAGGVSLTLDNADDLVLLDETWIPDDQEQVEDRIHRASRMHQVTIHYLRALGTVEENIAMTTGNRERMVKRLLDGERGVPFVKTLLTPIKRPV